MPRTGEQIPRVEGGSDHRLAGEGLSRGFGLVLAAATGLAVANLYDAQPLLHTIGDDLGTSEGRTGLVVTAGQVGDAGGLALLVSLGDLVARRRLIPGVLAAMVVALLGAAAAPSSVFWTTIWFHLSADPFGWGDGAIGLLGLVGAAGALCATAAGRLADRGLVVPGRIGAAVAVVASFGLLWTGRLSIAAIVLGVILLDVGVQGVQVLNQTIIYELAPEARSRITSAYMTCYFVDGALGSAVGAAADDAGGWGRACALGAVLGTAAVAMSAYAQVRSDRPAVRWRDAW